MNQKKLDCTNYVDNESCPKRLEILKPIKNLDYLNVLMVGCWGVYCWDGDVKLSEYKAPDDKSDSSHIFFKESQEKFGSKRVVRGMIKFTNKTPTDAVFLAGDNVYNYNIPKDRLIDLVNNQKNPPTKKMYKVDPSISPQDIDIQLQKGFLDCFNNVNVKDFYVAIGNHDVSTCYDLNQQLKFAQDPRNRYRLPGVYYNVIYPLKNYAVNFIVIDTNVLEEQAVNCKGVKYDKETTEKIITMQVEWVIKTLKRSKCLFNIIIGHIPYKANPHKQKDKDPDYILNKGLDYLFQSIKKDSDCPKVQAYFCADEHNQQFLYDNDHKMALVVAGSGGTALDKKIIQGKYWGNNDDDLVKTHYYTSDFGFVSFTFNNNNRLKIVYFTSTENKTDQKFQVILESDGLIKKKSN